MNKVKRERQKRNRKKKEMQFIDTKATFVAGVTVIMLGINDIIDLLFKLSLSIIWGEVVAVALLYYFALCTKKMDKFLSTKGAENFGSFLTLISIIEFILGNALINSVQGMKFAWDISNEVMWVALTLSIITVTAIICAFCLLFHKYPEK